MIKDRWTKLAGQLYLNFDTGDVEMRYGADGWFKKTLGNIKGTKVYDAVIMSYGKKEGKKIRIRAARAVMNSIEYKIKG